MLYYYSVSTRSFEHKRAHTYAKVITRALYYVISGRGRDVPDPSSGKVRNYVRRVDDDSTSFYIVEVPGRLTRRGFLGQTEHFYSQIIEVWCKQRFW